MKKILALLFILLVSCNQTDKNSAQTTATACISEEEPEIKIMYVNTIGRLNYRDAPKGKILGQLYNNDQVTLVEHTNIIEQIKDGEKLWNGEWVGITIKTDTVYVFDAYLSTTMNYKDVWSKFPIKKRPIVDTTNFDNFIIKDQLTITDISQLQLDKIYPELNDAQSEYSAYSSYRVDYKHLNALVVIILKGDHEMESVLIGYDQDRKLIEFYNGDNEAPATNSLIIAYDEIAEGWSRTTSVIDKHTISTISALYTEPAQIDTLLHHINGNGEINKVNIDFKNDITSKHIKMNTVYTDTILFKNYNDDYDYFYLEGIKNDKYVSLIYNWDMKPKYDFKENDLIQITWKMDSIYIAGDGETLAFSEFIIDAQKIK